MAQNSYMLNAPSGRSGRCFAYVRSFWGFRHSLVACCSVGAELSWCCRDAASEQGRLIGIAAPPKGRDADAAPRTASKPMGNHGQPCALGAILCTRGSASRLLERAGRVWGSLVSFTRLTRRNNPQSPACGRIAPHGKGSDCRSARRRCSHLRGRQARGSAPAPWGRLRAPGRSTC